MIQSVEDEFPKSQGYYLPTPEQIAEECRRIRAGWSPREHYVRAGLIPNWTVPERRAFADVDKSIR